MATALTVIDLWPREADCRVCDTTVLIRSTGPNYGIPVYEDEILPDDDTGDWGGVTVCPRCYFMVRGYQAEHRGRVPVHVMRRLAKDGDA